MLEDKDIDIQYIWSEDNPKDIMKKNTSEADFMRDMVGDKYIYIKYIQSEDNPEYIMTKQICKQTLRGTRKGSQRENSGS